jgi:glycosyltransferase involved in cell wall biosynthesis
VITKKKILILIDWYLPGTKAGGPVRSVHAMVMHLRNEFDFYILTTNKDLGETKPYENVQSDKWIEKDGYHVKYLSNVTSAALSAEMLDASYHHIYINSLYSKWFSVTPLKIARKNKISRKIILASRGMLGAGAMSIKPLKKRVFLAVANTLDWFKDITWHATGEHEKKDIQIKIKGSPKIVLAPNLSWIRVQENVQKEKKIGELKLFYLSRIARVKNLHLALEILQEIPTGNYITYHVFGPMEDEGYWNECQKIISQLPSHIKVGYKGIIDHDNLLKVLTEYHALFMPTSNENFGHSIIESLACGCPVLISDQTPWRDLGKAGFDLSLAELTEFRNVIVKWCHCDNVQWVEWQSGALERAKRFLNDEKAISAFINMFK